MKGDKLQRGILLVVLAISIAGLFFVLSRSQTVITPEEGELTHLTGTLPTPFSTISAASTTIRVMLAETTEERAQGLSGRSDLGEAMGMLFIFDHTEQYGFWMPDMHFPIDIIWIGEDWRIVDITVGATPESYPTLFKPRVPARYVLEVYAGNTAAWGWDIGTQFVFSR